MNGNFVLLSNPIIQSKVSIFRDKNCSCETFRKIVKDLSIFLCYEACKNFKLESYSVETPLEKTSGWKFESEISVVAVLRAGLGMVPGVLECIPDAHVGTIGMYRNEETLAPVEYYRKHHKNISDHNVLLVDPMLATGGSACDSVKILKEAGAKNISFLCLISAPDGVKRLQSEHPDVSIYTSSLDDHLNDKGYIVPGLGDAGDRIFGTL